MMHVRRLKCSLKETKQKKPKTTNQEANVEFYNLLTLLKGTEKNFLVTEAFSYKEAYIKT